MRKFAPLVMVGALTLVGCGQTPTTPQGEPAIESPSGTTAERESNQQHEVLRPTLPEETPQIQPDADSAADQNTTAPAAEGSAPSADGQEKPQEQSGNETPAPSIDP